MLWQTQCPGNGYMKCSSDEGNYRATSEFCPTGCELQESPAQVRLSNLAWSGRESASPHSHECQCGGTRAAAALLDQLYEKRRLITVVYTHSPKPPLEAAAGNAIASTKQPGSRMYHHGRSGGCVPDPRPLSAGEERRLCLWPSLCSSGCFFSMEFVDKHGMDRTAMSPW